MILLLLALSFSFEESKYRKCSDSRFCSRNRYIKNQKWSLNSESIKISDNQFEATIIDGTYSTNLKLFINFLSCGPARIRIRPINDEKLARYESSEDPSIIIQEELSKYDKYTMKKTNEGEILTGSNKIIIEIVNNPLKISLNDGSGPKIILNADDGAVFETNRPKDKYPELFESFSFDYQTDSIPNGPTSIAMTVDFISPGVRLSGLPSHSLPLTLPQTNQTENLIRLFNIDTIKFPQNSPMTMQGSVPFVMAHSQKGCEGLFWNNPSETWIDTSTILKNTTNENKKIVNQRARFISEGGFIDIFLFTGPTGKDITQKFTKLTGRPQLPPLFSFGFHQSRWGYYNKDFLMNVTQSLDENLVPHDSLWLDIDFLDRNREYFTFNKESTPNPTRFFKEITKAGRYVIVPVGPAIRAADDDYIIYKQAEQNHYFVQTRFNKSFNANGYCGKASWPDFLNEKVRSWWESLFKFSLFRHSMPRMFFWNELNAPTSFEDYELTFPRAMIHDNKYENREVHNVYGHLMTLATFNGLLKRAKNIRPFVLSNSFYAGTQKYAVLTIGGSPGEWRTLLTSVQIVLQLGLAGQVYSGIDVGGHFGKPNQKLVSRWYQVGAWIYPFFRTHCHHLASYREVYTLKNNEHLFNAARDAIIDRYLLLPYWYSLSRNANLTGEPIVRPIWWEIDQSDEKEFNHFVDVDNIAMLGSHLLVAPFLEENETDKIVRLPSNSKWYCYKSLQVVKESKDSKREVTVKYDSGRTAVFVKGGSIIPKKLQIRRSSELMLNDPYLLLIAVDDKDEASGSVYIDDGKSLDFVNNNGFINKLFDFDGKRLTSKNFDGATSNNAFASNFKARIEKIVITGLSKMPSKIHDKSGNQFNFNIENKIVTIDRIGLKINSDFEVDFEY